MANGGMCYVGGVAYEKAGQAACQAQPGAQWVPDAPAQQQQQESTSNPWMTAAKGLGTAAAFGIGLTPAGRALKVANAGRKLFMGGKPMQGRVGGLMDKLFRREGAAGNPGFVLPGGVSKISRVKGQKGFDYSPPGVTKQTFNTNPLTGGATEATRALNPYTIGATVAGGGGAAAMYAGRGGGAEQRALDEKANNTKTLTELMDRQKQIDDAKKNNETPKKELSFAERVKIGLKDKDTVYKLGLLMSELGNNDPNRASKLLEHNNALAKNASSSYTALKNMILSPKELADSIFIDGGGNILGFGKMDEGQQKAAAQSRGNAINALMHELAMAGKLPTMENAQALFYARNPDKDPRNKEKKPEDEDKDPWYKFFS